ncbi:indolepyruvate ferredoxin oxidoreductase family protein [Microbulbifer hydrolyticus]|uniref:Indolepyruvate ferredoxin oxidoreductase n=1 Tax=Microbulbifer hydrolyticus TaxID=48074 RepID=A0A6P1TB83_9GAMM|nr:indolepyruvate ferredoxin oxidoreductase family protein [Microbulbifer hydrolyticus]MBB5210217.1 indolepyruvate ferredoxin oxidoreductase [Microbulbifer hydrolyticus]QHQ39277.1 indolepyruvate ferredoxin oxidoreductase family protein [Microbulbifer hydrolyticus]
MAMVETDQELGFDREYSLKAAFTRDAGRVFLTGIDALVRLPLMQKQLDEQAGLNTAGFISGYRGSPLGGYDQALWRHKKLLAERDIHFEPGINEDLGATNIWGTQLLDHYRQQATRDGVFSIWYGKGHGVDRSADVFRQANIQGTSRLGGVLALCGDDHTAESSMFSHNTDQIFESVMMPLLFPATIDEYLTLGVAGIALSRFSGLWVGFKTITETVESGASIVVPSLPNFVLPESFPVPAHGLNYDPHLNWPAERMEYERRMLEERLPAAKAFAYANKLDKTIVDAPQKRFGIVTVGKAHGDLLEALKLLELTEQDLLEAGISIHKVAMSWPLEPRGMSEFAHGMERILVVEEKRPLVEDQMKNLFYGWADNDRPRVVGKKDLEGNDLLPAIWGFGPDQVAKAIARWLADTELATRLIPLAEKLGSGTLQKAQGLLAREPIFCAGCPHNSSTKLPEGSTGSAGIGCHIMALGKGLRTDTYSHMGGEGAHWVGLHRFSSDKHIFQNMGDGTYNHSGLLAIRQAVASKINITYKILLNDAVAMTGGQPADGEVTVPTLSRQLLAEGVGEVCLVSENPEHWQSRRNQLPKEIKIFHRDELDDVQRKLRDTSGVTAIIYEQVCAAEKRRRRKKGQMVDPARRLLINHRVCEGCGDCSVQSSCIAVEPLETEYGRKRQVNQSSCNKDMRCADGFCPSFVSVEGGELKKPALKSLAESIDEASRGLADAPKPQLDQPLSILVAGIGGSGVLTVAALLGMAAHLEEKGSTTLYFTGLSQKNGAVVAHVKVGNRPQDITTARIRDGAADLLLGCDMVTAAAQRTKFAAGEMKALVNTAEVPVAAFVRNNELAFPAGETAQSIESVAGEYFALDANRYAEALFGDTVAANLMMMGYACQQGLLPVSQSAIERAVELNGVAVENNLRAFRAGRLLVENPRAIDQLLSPAQVVKLVEPQETTEQLVARLATELTEYQSAAYARRFTSAIEALKSSERRLSTAGDKLTRAAALSLFKAMAYKDEYEVARLYSGDAFQRQLRETFSGDYKLKFLMAPPLFARPDASGKIRKIALGPWLAKVLPVLARGKVLRGTPLDVFGYTAERRRERKWAREVQQSVLDVAKSLGSGNIDLAEELLALPQQVRGYGHVRAAKFDGIHSRWNALRERFQAGEGGSGAAAHSVAVR